MEPNGSSRRTIALYGGDSAASGFIPGIGKLGPAVHRSGLRLRGGQLGPEAGIQRAKKTASREASPNLRKARTVREGFAVSLAEIAAGFRFPKRAWGERN